MAWWLLLGIFWKPLYFSCRFLYSKFVSKNDEHMFWIEQAKAWFVQLVNLVKP